MDVVDTPLDDNISSEVALFDPVMTQLGLLNEYDRSFSPKAAIAKGMPIEFIIKGAAQQYMDLNAVKMRVKCKIVKPDGSNLAAADVPIVGPVNNILHSMFQEVGLILGTKPVSDPSNMYPYRAYLENLLNYDKTVQKNRLLTEGWVLDEVGDGMDAIGDNDGLAARARDFAQSHAVTLIGRPHVDLFQQGKLLPPGVDMEVKFIPSDDTFVLMRAAGDGVINFKLIIEDMQLIVRFKQLTEALEVAHRKLVISGKNYRLPYTRVQTKNVSIPRGVRAFNFENLYTGVLPDRIIIALVDDEAFAGQYTRNPFNFKHFNISRFELKRNGVSCPRLPYQPNFDNASHEYMTEYLQFQEQCGFAFGDKCVLLTPEQWAHGYTVFAFKVTDGPIGPGDISPRSRSSEGNIKIELNFARETPNNIKLIILSESPGILEIDQFNNPIIM
jgi:hypothetical protein